MDMGTNMAKLLSACVLALIRLAASTTPIQIHNIIYGKNKKVTDDAVFRKKLEKYDLHMIILRSFGSGVFLCTCLVHLMPEVVENLIEGSAKNEIFGNSVPISAFAQFYICLGFFTIYFIEEFCHWIITKVPTIPITPKWMKVKRHGFHQSFSYIQDTSRNSQLKDNSEHSNETVVSYIQSGDCKSEKKFSKSLMPEVDDITGTKNISQMNLNKTSVGQRLSCLDKATRKVDKRQLVSFVFGGAGVILHAFFEGIAIGLQHKKASNVWFLTIAMMIHSVTSLFCVGMKFLAIRATKRSIIIHFIMQALASPAGILLGYSILVGWKLEQTLVIDGFFAALSTGTILYITFFESLSKEKQMRVLRVCRSISMISGFGVMCALEYYIFMEKSVLNGQYVQLKSWMNGNGSHSSESAV